MNVVLTVLVVGLIKNCLSQSACVTPNGENGNCILLNDCKPFTSIWNQRTSKHIAFLRKSHCGFQEDKPLVCCGSVAEMTESNKQETTESAPFTSSPVSTTESAPISSSIAMTTPAVPITTAQLFTSAITTNTPPVTRSISIPSTSSRFESHSNFNLLPPRGECGVQTAGERITQGNVTDLDEYPWIAMLMYKFENKILPNCGGSLINSKYVLTAAHCIKGNLFAVRLGEYNLDTEEDCIIQEGDEVCALPHQEFKIEEYKIFSGYSTRNINRYHDIAIIRLKGVAIITDFVRPICLPINNERSASGDQLTVAGWGLTENNVTSTIKLAVDVPVWSDLSCQEIYSIGYGVNVSTMQFCAGGQSGKDSCGGDSGGPLMRTLPNATEYYQEGVVSFGPQPCGRQATPGVYVRVSEYISWILDNMTP